MVGLHQFLAGNVTHYHMLGTTTKLSMLFQFLGLWLHLKEVLGLAVIIINVKSTETKDKNIKDVKGCRDGMPKMIK